MTLFEKLCMAVIVAPLSVLLIEGALFVRQARLDADKITGEAAGWNRGVWDVLGNTSAAMKVVAQIGAKERNDFDAQQEYYKNLSNKSGVFLDSLTTTVDDFHRTVLPRVADTLDSAAALETSAARNLTDTTIKIDNTIESLRPIIDNGIVATQAAAAAMSDPAIHETLTHVDEASAHAAIAADQAAQTTAHLNDAARDFAAYVHRMTAPARGVWNAFKELLGLAAQARQAGGI